MKWLRELFCDHHWHRYSQSTKIKSGCALKDDPVDVYVDREFCCHCGLDRIWEAPQR